MTREELERFVGKLVSVDNGSSLFWRGRCLISLDEEHVCFYDGNTYIYAYGKPFGDVNILYDDVEFFNNPEHWVKEHWGEDILNNIMNDEPPSGFKTTIGKSFVKDGMIQNPFTGRWSWL